MHRLVLASSSVPETLSSSGAVASVLQPDANQATAIMLMVNFMGYSPQSK